MGLIYWLLIGFAAGAAAKYLSPQEETGGWISSIAIGCVGAFVGKLIFGLVGIQSSNIVGSLLIAIAGAVIVLFVYYKYLADKWKLPL